MSRKVLLLAAPLALVAMGSAPSTEPAVVGAPWMSLEIPANPMDQTANGAALLVHAYMHERPARFHASGTAEGLVDGQRRSIPLEFTETSRAGVYALKQQWPSQGQWILNLSINAGQSTPSLLVELAAGGGVEDVEYYGMRTKVLAFRSVRLAEGKVAAAQIDAALKRLASE